jgi:hypothetical protein
MTLSGTTVGITVLIILGSTIFSQLLTQRSEYKKRHQKLLEHLDRLEARPGQ